MKTPLTLLIAAALTGAAAADFEKWTNKEGKNIELELQNVTAAGGHFKMRDGRIAILKAADLSEADAKRLAEWKPPTAEVAKAPSAFDAALEGHLVVFKGKSSLRSKASQNPRNIISFITLLLGARLVKNSRPCWWISTMRTNLGTMSSRSSS